MQGRRSLVSSPSDTRTERAKRRRNSSEMAPPPPTPPIEQINNHPTSIPCDKCGLNVLHTDDHVVCIPCSRRRLSGVVNRSLAPLPTALNATPPRLIMSVMRMLVRIFPILQSGIIIIQ